MTYMGGHYDGMRASDADRERAADVLRAAFGEGRIDNREHQRRIDAVMRAQTYGELRRLTEDLPQGALPTAQPQYPVAQPYGMHPALRPPKEGLATASFVLSLASFATCGATTIPAVVTGHIALSRIKRNGTEGHGLAVAGLTIGYLEIALGVIWIILMVVIGVAG